MSRRSSPRPRQVLGALLALPVLLAALFRPVVAAPYPTTREDFRLPGTQPLAVTDPFATPDACAPCHSNFGAPLVEPVRSWKGSMMAQSGRDPLMWAALAVANQDLAHSGETCLRCHLPKGWLEGRSAPEDGTAMTAADREGVQCSVCHRLVDPIASAENPPADGPILAALAAPVPAFGSAMMVLDPIDRLRGPFDVVADLGADPHLPTRPTLVSPFHRSAELCGTCHNVRNPAYTRNLAGEYELNALDTPGDPTAGFPEQSTYDEWAASAYAAGGIPAPQFGGTKTVVATCQDCHMPDTRGRDASTGLLRDDVPLHTMVGGNTFVPRILPHHPAFGGEVDAALLEETIAAATAMLRKAATVELGLAGGALTVRVVNETGHKLPTGYPDGRRMWLHVRAFDRQRAVVFESGRYLFATAELVGYGAAPSDPDWDPHLHVWETIHGISPAAAVQLGVSPGPSQHLVLNNVREKDNRIPPRGFTNAAYAAFDGAPVGASYADDQHWDDVIYPVGPAAVQAEATLYYQTTSREYVEFLRDENTTTVAGTLLFDLWNAHGKSAPVALAHAFLESDARVVARCQKAVARQQARFQQRYLKEWARCYETETRGLTCDAAARDARLAAAVAKLRDQVGGVKDRQCAGRSLTPITLGHPGICPVPCAARVLFDMADLAGCALCVSEALGATALDAAYGVRPPAVPPTRIGTAGACQRTLAKAATGLADGWARALGRCAQRNLKLASPLDCATDPEGRIARARSKAERRIAQCDAFAGLAGCATAGDPPGTLACMEAALEAVVPGVAAVAFP